VKEADLRGRRVLDVGCGTGRLAAALAQSADAEVAAVDPEPAMLEVARGRVPAGVAIEQARAERLPFADEFFDRVVLWLVVHLVDRPAAFGEAARVLARGGKLALVTFAPQHFGEYWLNPFFPSLEAVDRARFPTPAQLGDELPAAGFAPPRFVRLRQEATLSRAEAIDRIRGGHISTFDLLDPEEVRAGTGRAERDLPETVTTRLHWLLVVADR
jgi:ubiquinone/menaquinone biosynthesis C-methylase UbiE